MIKKITTMHQSTTILRRSVIATGFLHKGKIHNSQREVDLCIFFNVKPIFNGTVIVKEVKCHMPQPRWTKVNIDGSAKDKLVEHHVEAFLGCIGNFPKVILCYHLEYKLQFL